MYLLGARSRWSKLITHTTVQGGSQEKVPLAVLSSLQTISCKTEEIFHVCGAPKESSRWLSSEGKSFAVCATLWPVLDSGCHPLTAIGLHFTFSGGANGSLDGWTFFPAPARGWVQRSTRTTPPR